MKKTTFAIAVVAAGASGRSGGSGKTTPTRERIVQLLTDLATVTRRGKSSEDSEPHMTSDTTVLATGRASVVFMVLLGLCAGVAAAQTADVPKSPYAYHNDVFVGGSYLRTQLGRSIKDTNFAGGNVGATHYFTPHLGFAVDGQADYGHASIVSLPSANPSVYKYQFMAGPQIRWSIKKRYSSSIQLFVGAVDSRADTDTLGGPPTMFGLYPNATKLAFNPGTTFDYNLSSRVALRISSGSLLERQNGDFQSEFNISTGLLFRIGKSE
jgi:hypothetical protein